MKLNLLLSGLFLISFPWQSSIYDIHAVLVSGDSVSISSFANKKIIISPFDAVSPDTSWLMRLDSLQRSDTSFQVIAVPANDFDGQGNDTTLASLKDSLSLSILMFQSAFVKKSAVQDALFKWLTDVNENTHFDLDVDLPNQLFIVSKTGILYGVLPANVPSDVLTQVLSEDVEQNN